MDNDAAKTNAATINITNCTFSKFNAGIYINAGQGTIENNEFVDCSDGISIDQLGGKLTVKNNTFTNVKNEISVCTMILTLTRLFWIQMPMSIRLRCKW